MNNVAETSREALHGLGLTDLPQPLTPADCNLQDFAFMPLDVARLRDSDLAASETPEACWAAVLLWAASWHQVPAASIPNDDRWIAKQAGYAQRGKIAREWPEIREGALRGWVECADGRLYHPVVAEKAREGWQAKLEQRWRNECGRIKKHNQRHGTELSVPDFVSWTNEGCPCGHPLPVPDDKKPRPQDVNVDEASKGQREGQGQGQGQGDSEEKPTASGAVKPRPARKCPDSFAVTDEMRAWAVEKVPGTDLQAETDKFRDHTFAHTITDWPGAWRNWLRRANEGRTRGPAASTPRRSLLNLNHREGVNSDGSFS